MTDITRLKTPPHQMKEHQALVDAIMDTIEDFSEETPLSNLVVYGALEIVKLHYMNSDE